VRRRRDLVVLDLGRGDQRQYPTNIGVDRRRTPSVTTVADVSRPLPFRAGSVDRIFAVHVLEHLIDFLPMVADCHRVLRPGGVLHVLSPWWKHVNAVADPTHVRLLDKQTVKGICSGPDRHAWYPLHVGRDESTVFADLTPLPPGEGPDERQLARFVSV
jgi:SAM-dependent methyltransferase